MLLKVSGKCSSFEVKAAHRNQKAHISFAEFGKVLNRQVIRHNCERLVNPSGNDHLSNDVPENLM